MRQYDYLCSIGELIDKLTIENIKCYDANTQILHERCQSRVPNGDLISRYEWKARVAGEQRVRLREEINRRLDEAIRRGGIETAPEIRTYELPGRNLLEKLRIKAEKPPKRDKKRRKTSKIREKPPLLPWTRPKGLEKAGNSRISHGSRVRLRDFS